MSMRIAIDLCNTLCDVNGALEYFLGVKRKKGSYFIDGLPNNFFENHPEFFSLPKPYQSAASVLQVLSQSHDILYVTARPKSSDYVTLQYLEKNGFPKAPIIFSNNKALLGKNLGVSVAIEDAPHEIQKYQDIGIPVLIKDWDYNRNFNGTRFEWNQLYEMICKTCFKGGF